MKQYITFINNPNKDVKRITDPEEFLLSKGKKGLKDNRLLIHKHTKTVLRETNLNNIRNSKKFKRIEKNYNYINQKINRIMSDFNELLLFAKKEDLYTTFKIPKRSGGWREITAPKESLKELQRKLKNILIDDFELLPHHNAHAYTKERSIKTNAETHMHSNHFGNIDLENFFPSITKDMLIDILKQIDIFGLEEMDLFVQFIADIATVDGSLPQGTPLSPLLSNLIMIPFDYHISKNLEKEEKAIVVTRYADDITFSSFYQFALTKIEAKDKLHRIIKQAMLDAYGNENFFKINEKKSRISTKNGKNRITGIKVNKDNQISIGYKEKRQVKQDLASLIIDKLNGEAPRKPVDEVIGYYNFLHAIEPDYADYVLRTLQRKFNLTQSVLKYISN